MRRISTSSALSSSANSSSERSEEPQSRLTIRCFIANATACHPRRECRIPDDLGQISRSQSGGMNRRVFGIFAKSSSPYRFRQVEKSPVRSSGPTNRRCRCVSIDGRTPRYWQGQKPQMKMDVSAGFTPVPADSNGKSTTPKAARHPLYGSDHSAIARSSQARPVQPPRSGLSSLKATHQAMERKWTL
jgi:hypothetical protein